jgi:hypothetical protein
MTPSHQPRPVPQIRNVRLGEGSGAIGVWLPSDCPFGSLRLKQAKIVLRVDEANWRIASAFDQWQRLAGGLSLRARSRHNLDLESAVFLLQRAADEFISLHAVLGHLEEHGRYPDRVGIDGVAALLRHGPLLSAAPYRNHQVILRTLTDIGNAHKHTRTDAGPDTSGAREPVICALALRRHGLNFGPRFFHVPLRSLVEDFDRLYQDCLGWLAAWSQRHLREAAA